MSRYVTNSGLLDTDLEFLVLTKLRKLEIGGKLIVAEVAKRDPEGFIKVVQKLISCGWSEYEFSNDYKEVKRLDLPDFARDYYREQSMALKLNEHETKFHRE
jgi:hypothetical protein